MYLKKHPNIIKEIGTYFTITLNTYSEANNKYYVVKNDSNTNSITIQLFNNDQETCIAKHTWNVKNGENGENSEIRVDVVKDPVTKINKTIPYYAFFANKEVQLREFDLEFEPKVVLSAIEKIHRKYIEKSTQHIKKYLLELYLLEKLYLLTY